jgi:hypothetical protein
MKVPSMEETLDQVEMLREWGGDVSGRPVSDGALSKSISAYNENRRLLSGLEERAASDPGAYSALEFIRLVRSAGALPREAHTVLLRAALSRGPAPVRRARARLFLGGGTAPLRLMKAIDAARGVLVGDDLEEGHRYNEAVADESGDPALALSRRLRARLLGLEEGEDSQAVRLLDRVEASGADRLLYVGTAASAGSGDAAIISSEAGRRGVPFLYHESDAATGFSRLDEERIAAFITQGGQGG